MVIGLTLQGGVDVSSKAYVEIVTPSVAVFGVRK